MEYIIREIVAGTPEFIEAINMIVEMWPKQYTKDTVINNFLSDNTLFVLGMFVDGLLIGVVSGQKSMLDEKNISPWLGTLVIKEECRGLGHGRNLVHEIMNKFKEMGYKNIFLYTGSAQKFYEKHGWHHEKTIYPGRKLDIYSFNLDDSNASSF